MNAMSKLLAPILLAFFSNTGTACSFALQTLDDFTRAADSIYIATLLEAKYIPGDFLKRSSRVEGKFKVDKILKGKVSQQLVTLNADGVGGSCSIPMIVQSRYVVFNSGEDNALSSGSGSTVIESFQVDDISKKIIASVKRSARKKKLD